MDDSIRQLVGAIRTAPPPRAQPTVADEPSALMCPVCQTQMIVERNHGTAVDVCRAHGMWFDLGELPRLLDHIEAGNQANLEDAIADARHSGKVSGMLFGAWSLLFD